MPRVRRNGKIVQEDIVGDTFTEDLKVLARSELGQAVLHGQTLDTLSAPERDLMRQLLKRVTARRIGRR